MAAPHGEFTRKFDREILKLPGSKEREETAREHKERKKRERIEAELAKIEGLLQYRKDWLKERFSNIVLSAPEEGRRGLVLSLEKDGVQAFLEFNYRLNDSGLAVLLESRTGAGEKKLYDYTSFPAESVEYDRAKNFIEAKILEFAKEYAS